MRVGYVALEFRYFADGRQIPVARLEALDPGETESRRSVENRIKHVINAVDRHALPGEFVGVGLAVAVDCLVENAHLTRVENEHILHKANPAVLAFAVVCAKHRAVVELRLPVLAVGALPQVRGQADGIAALDVRNLRIRIIRRTRQVLPEIDKRTVKVDDRAIARPCAVVPHACGTCWHFRRYILRHRYARSRDCEIRCVGRMDEDKMPVALDDAVGLPSEVERLDDRVHRRCNLGDRRAGIIAGAGVHHRGHRDRKRERMLRAVGVVTRDIPKEIRGPFVVRGQDVIDLDLAATRPLDEADYGPARRQLHEVEGVESDETDVFLIVVDGDVALLRRGRDDHNAVY